MAKSFNIETVVSEFKHWRSRKSNSEAIPDNLWQLVVKLRGHYSRGLICKKLGITVGQMRRKGLVAEQVASTNKKLKNTVSPFITVSPTATTALAHNASVSSSAACIEIHRQDGVKLVIKQPDNTQLSTLLQQFMGGI